MPKFSTRIIAWQRLHGRHSLPWQTDRDPYRIWLSEIMLQQTQVATVIPYFLRFVERFPDFPALANASEDEVLRLWSGLGYYRRARNLHKAAKRVMVEYDGKFPMATNRMETLPGVGRSTAAAIAALAFGQTRAILDGNAKRVLARHAGISGWPGKKAVEIRLWTVAESRLPNKNIETYTQGIMDLGATVCIRTRPVCTTCPVACDCVALQRQLTSSLPTARPKKTLPHRSVQMLIVLHRKNILLEKRPPNGIWGGLWSFPEIDTETDALDYCKTMLGLNADHGCRLPTLKHCFTHFRLTISPLLLNLEPEHVSTPKAGQCWFTKQDLLHTAVPVPVRKLLMQF